MPKPKSLMGTVKMIQKTKSFGFIHGDDGIEYFFHSSAAPEWEMLDRGTPVRFEPSIGQKGPRAEAVERV